MRSRTIWLLIVVALMVAALAAPAAEAQTTRNFVAHLSGANETPPVATLAQGQAIFHVSADGTAIEYELIVANIDDVTAAHIHLGLPGVAGPVVAFLYPGPTRPGRTDGILAQGTITAADLVGPLAGHPLSHLLAAMQTGGAYANVHTTAHPGGEIRGQIH